MIDDIDDNLYIRLLLLFIIIISCITIIINLLLLIITITLFIFIALCKVIDVFIKLEIYDNYIALIIHI